MMKTNSNLNLRLARSLPTFLFGRKQRKERRGPHVFEPLFGIDIFVSVALYAPTKGAISRIQRPYIQAKDRTSS